MVNRIIIGAAIVVMAVMIFATGIGIPIAWQYFAAEQESTRLDDTLRQELVVDLPQDANNWTTTIVYEGTTGNFTAADRKLRSQFWAEPRLRSLVAQTTLTTYYSDTKLWKEKYRDAMGDVLPQVWVQNNRGDVIYKKSGYVALGSNQPIPADARVLADEIQEQIRVESGGTVGQLSAGQVGQYPGSNCPGPNCPNPNPDFRPKPDGRQPLVDWNKGRIPDIGPHLLRPSGSSVGWPVVIGVIVASVVIAGFLGLIIILGLVAVTARR